MSVSELSSLSSASYWVEFERRLHSHLDLDAVAYELVNEARRLLDCDRATLLIFRRSRPHILAVSGQDELDRRSSIVRAVEAFTAVIGPTEEPFFYEGPPVDTAPQIESALMPLIDVTSARRLGLVPLRAAPLADDETSDPVPPRVVGWLLAEEFAPTKSASVFQAALLRAAQASAPALRQALYVDELPLRRLGQAIRRWTRGRRLSRLGAAALTVVAATAALVFVPAELTIEATGVMQPERRRHVFAPVDGVVTELAVKHGELVQADQRLLTMRRPELEFELTRLDGEIQTREKRLFSIQAARLRRTGATAPDPDEVLRLTAEEQEVLQETSGLRAQRDELRRQSESLTVASPLSGRVLTWDVERQLQVRPVQKGALLLTVGDVDGPWELELRVPDAYAGYVRQRRRESADPPTVEFVSAAAAEGTYEARLTDLALRSNIDAEGRSTVVGTATLAADVPREVLHSDSAVTAKIHCGRTSLGHLWLLDLIHLWRTQVWF